MSIAELWVDKSNFRNTRSVETSQQEFFFTPAHVPGWPRDVMQASLANPSFDGIHKYKIAAMKQTFAFPAKTQAALYALPRLTVALVLTLGASLLQLLLT